METAKNILEIVYLLSGPALVVIAYLALSQIRIAKEQLQAQREATNVSVKRDALKATSEQIARYSFELIPLQDALFKKIKDENIKFFKESKTVITGDKISVNPCSDKAEMEKLASIGMEFTRAMNSIEGFSVYFISGVADEEIAFRSIAETFCTTINDLLPLLVPLTKDGNRFSSTMQLFMIWHARRQKENWERQKLDLENKINTHSTQTIKPFGSNASD